MIGVTIGVGEGWRECAEWAADRMEQTTGLSCHVLDGRGCGNDFHASWLKHRILRFFPSAESVLYFDADIISLRDWNPKEIFEKNGRKICAVRDNDPDMAKEVRVEEHCLALPANTYLNAGLFIFGREHAPVFEKTWSRRPKFHRWIDQSAWNWALNELKVPVAVLPEIYNHQLRIRPETINTHVCGLAGNWKQLQEYQNDLIPGAADNAQPAQPVPTK